MGMSKTLQRGVIFTPGNREREEPDTGRISLGGKKSEERGYPDLVTFCRVVALPAQEDKQSNAPPCPQRSNTGLPNFTLILTYHFEW